MFNFVKNIEIPAGKSLSFSGNTIYLINLLKKLGQECNLLSTDKMFFSSLSRISRMGGRTVLHWRNKKFSVFQTHWRSHSTIEKAHFLTDFGGHVLRPTAALEIY